MSLIKRFSLLLLGLFLCLDANTSREPEPSQPCFFASTEKKEITKKSIQKLFKGYFSDDPSLKDYIRNFNLGSYSIYGIENDLFYIENDSKDQESHIKDGFFVQEPAYDELLRYAHTGGVVIDIGKPTRMRTLDLSELVEENGTVHLFIPEMKRFTELVIDGALNECKNVHFYRHALGKAKKEEGPVRVQALDHFQLNSVSLIKMDVDGKEMEVIKGGLKTILRDKPALLIKMEEGPETKRKIEEIENLGYNYFPTTSANDHLFISTQINDEKFYNKAITIAILAKDKAHVLPLYLACIELQNWPANKTHLYIRTNNNNDTTAQILRDWVDRVGQRYASVHLDDSDVPESVQNYKQHEWNEMRFKVLGKIRQDSIEWAKARGTHYFVVDCDNFIHPDTLSAMVRTDLPIVAPFLRAGNGSAYANYHAAVDNNGYLAFSHLYYPILTREFQGLINLPVVHCSYFIRHDVLDKINYDDNSGRYEYVIFSDQARKQNIPQFLDNRRLYGRLTFAESPEDMQKEDWTSEFWYTK